MCLWGQGRRALNVIFNFNKSFVKLLIQLIKGLISLISHKLFRSPHPHPRMQSLANAHHLKSKVTFVISKRCLIIEPLKYICSNYWKKMIEPWKLFLVNATCILSQLLIKSTNAIFNYFVCNENYKICNKTLSQPLFETDYNQYQGT